VNISNLLEAGYENKVDAFAELQDNEVVVTDNGGETYHIAKIDSYEILSKFNYVIVARD
jgi:hypothetical protein